MPTISSNKELIYELKELKSEIEQIFKNPYEKKVLNYFDFISWLESKIQGRDFADVVREKSKVFVG